LDRLQAAIIGTGNVGAAASFALALQGAAERIVPVNRTVEKAQAEALDIQHALALTPHSPRISAGGLAASASSGLVVVTISARVTVPDRRAAAKENAKLLAEWIPRLAEASPEAVFVIVTNPVDEMTYLALRYSGLPPERVIGTGTLIDSARFRALVSAREGIHPDDLRVYILGEHGDRQFPALSIATAGGETLQGGEELRALFRRAVESGYEVFRRKGYTNYAIAAAIAMVAGIVARDERRTLPVSTLIDGYQGVRDVCLSLPVVLGRGGIQRRLNPPLSPDEAGQFREAARAVRDSLDGLLGNPSNT
jgi:L-lactate dehydrogenase